MTLAVLLLIISLFETTQAAYLPSDGGKTLHIIMYHSILKDPARTGKYVVTPAQLKADFEYLRKHGYTSVLRLSGDLMKLQKELENNGITVPVCYTYPFGIIGSGSLSTVKKCGFSVSLSCSEKSNTVTRDPESLWLLGRYNRSGLVNTESFMKKAGIV